MTQKQYTRTQLSNQAVHRQQTSRYPRHPPADQSCRSQWLRTHSNHFISSKHNVEYDTVCYSSVLHQYFHKTHTIQTTQTSPKHVYKQVHFSTLCKLVQHSMKDQGSYHTCNQEEAHPNSQAKASQLRVKWQAERQTQLPNRPFALCQHLHRPKYTSQSSWVYIYNQVLDMSWFCATGMLLCSLCSFLLINSQ